MRTANGIALLAVTMLLLPAGVTAQEHEHLGRPDSAAQNTSMPMGSTIERDRMAMMSNAEIVHRALQFSPALILQNRERLDLTANQVIRLERLLPQRSAGAGTGPAAGGSPQSDLLRRMFEARSPDTAAVRVAAEQVFALHAAMHADRIAAAAAARAILSPEQRELALQVSSPAMCSMMDDMMPVMKGNTPQGPPGPTDSSGGHAGHHPDTTGQAGRP